MCDGLAVGLVSFNYYRNDNYPVFINVISLTKTFSFTYLLGSFCFHVGYFILFFSLFDSFFSRDSQILFISCGGFLGLPLKDTQISTERISTSVHVSSSSRVPLRITEKLLLDCI